MDKEKTRSRPKWAGPALLTVVVVGCLYLATWLFFATLDHFLGEESSFGEITIKPYGYDRTEFFHQRWDSLEISGPTFKIKLTNPAFKLTPKDSVFFGINVDDVNVALSPSSDTSVQQQDSTPLTIPEIPNLSLIFRVKASVGHALVNVEKTGQWEASGISLYNPSRKQIQFKAESISGTHLPSTIQVSADAEWNQENITFNTETVTGKDTVAISATGLRKDILNSSIDTEIQIANPEKFIPDYPDAAPSLKNLKVKAKVKNDSTRSIRYSATVEADLGERYPLPPMHAAIKATGDNNSARFHILTTTKDGGSIELHGAGTKNLDGEVEGSVKNISAVFGPERMPLDVTIHSARKTGNTIYAKTTTKAGSNVNAEITLVPNLEIHYTGDISPTEPWAVQWTSGNLKFASRPQVIGEFSDGEMRANVRIGKIPYVYFMAADSLQTNLALTSKGIHFDKGYIHGKNEDFTFTGEVMWDDIEPHTSWEVKASDGGNARARINLDGPSIIADADGVLFSGIPFAKRYIPEWADARVTGTYSHDFELDTAVAELKTEASIQMFNTTGDFKVKLRQDTVILENAEVLHEQNKINLQASIVLPNENTPRGILPVEVLNAWVSTRSFSIPLSLLPLGDSTLSAGEFSGDLSFTDSHGFHGNIEFDNISFRNIPKEVFSIRQMNLFAERAKAELDAYLEIGNGTWDGRTQITFDQILGNRKHFSFAHITNTGGNILGDGYLDSTLSANVKFDGYWLLPEGIGELRNSDLSVAFNWEMNRGLNGIKATFFADSTVYAPLTMDYTLPIMLEGNVYDKTINVTNAVTKNKRGDSITVNLSYAFDLMRLQNLNINTDHYTVNFGPHSTTVENVSATLKEYDDEISIDATIPSLIYNFNSDSYGTADAKAHGSLHYHLPKSKSINNRLSNNIEGNIFIDKLIYQKDIDIEITPSSVSQLLNSLQNTLASLRHKNETSKTEIAKTNPTSLNIHVSDSQQDSVAIRASFADFPFTINFDVQGTVSHPTLRGEIANAGEGFVGFKGLYEFNLQSMLVSWAGVPWQQGALEISISQDLPYCTETEDTKNETCPVNIDVNGTITNPLATPNSYCGTESSTAAIYYNVFLGCISENQSGDNVDWNKLAGTAIGKVISTTANKTLGGNYIGNIDMKMRIFSNTETLEEDSSYVKIPISLDKWVNNLSIVLGYTQDQSIDPTYEQAFEFGINYKLPFFQEAEYSHQNHLNPELSVGAMLVSKQYHVNSGTQEDENQLEKNIGIIYNYRFWSPCIFGIGDCSDYNEEEMKKKEPEKAK